MPVLVSWRPSLSVFVQEIDDQHKELYACLNRFLEAILAGKARDEIGTFLKFLIDYCVVHFYTEEMYMQAYEFPGYYDHKKEHERLTSSVSKLRNRIEQEVTRDHVIDLMKEMDRWLTDHIEDMDKVLGAFVRAAQGLEMLPPLSDLHLCGAERARRQPDVMIKVPCLYEKECDVMFNKFRDPASSAFWKEHYCMSSGGRRCRRKQLRDELTSGFDVPISLLPDGQCLETLKW